MIPPIPCIQHLPPPEPPPLSDQFTLSWTYGPEWAKNGEIDILEGVHKELVNQMTLHTETDCIVDEHPHETGDQLNASCAPRQPGCSVRDKPGTPSYGTEFNRIGGGVFATLWTSAGVKIWFFPRGNIPEDIGSGKPKPEGWREPNADFVGGKGCEFDKHFRDHRIVSLHSQISALRTAAYH